MRLMVVLMLLFLLKASVAFPQDSANMSEQDPYEWSAKVGAADSIGWYVMAKPLREYEVLTVIKLDVNNGVIDQIHLKQLYNILKYRGIKLHRAYPKADGLLTPGGETFKLIKYTDDVERHSRISNVQTVAGKQVYFWSEPLKVNEKAFRVPHDGQLEAQHNYLKKGMEALVKTAKAISQEKDKPFDALVIKKDYIQAIKYYTPDS